MRNDNLKKTTNKVTFRCISVAFWAKIRRKIEE